MYSVQCMLKYISFILIIMSRQDVYTTYETEQHSKARGICFVRDSGPRAGRTSNFGDSLTEGKGFLVGLLLFRQC